MMTARILRFVFGLARGNKRSCKPIEIHREAFGEHPAGRRFSKTLLPSRAAASCTHSTRFATVGRDRSHLLDSSGVFGLAAACVLFLAGIGGSIFAAAANPSVKASYLRCEYR